MKILLAILINLFCLQVAFGQLVEESLPYRSEPAQYWITLVTKKGAILLPADLKKTPDQLVLSAFVNDDPQTLINGVVVYADGAVLSTPLHEIGKGQLEVSSETAGVGRLEKLKVDTVSARERLLALQAENAAMTVRLRKQAGLDEVDRVYARIEKIESEIKSLNRDEGQ